MVFSTYSYIIIVFAVLKKNSVRFYKHRL